MYKRASKLDPLLRMGIQDPNVAQQQIKKTLLMSTRWAEKQTWSNNTERTENNAE